LIKVVTIIGVRSHSIFEWLANGAQRFARQNIVHDQKKLFQHLGVDIGVAENGEAVKGNQDRCGN
jgi:hypothetical protein